ncbi:MAG: ATP-binding protein [Deferribacterales bacterium]
MIDILLYSSLAVCLAVILVMYRQNSISPSFIKIVSRLIKMNEVDGSDPSLFIKNLEAFLSRLGVSDYGYYIHYLNTEYYRPKKSGRDSVTKFVYTADYTVFVELVPRFAPLRQNNKVRMLTEVIFMIIMSDISIQTKAAEKAFRKSYELQAFINHDVKNLIQFVNVLEHNLKDIDEGELKDYMRLVRYLKKGIPGLKHRSDKILSALSSTMPEPEGLPEDVPVVELARAIADSYDVELNTSTPRDMIIRVNRKILSIIFDNIIKNFYDKSIMERGISFYLDAVETSDGVTVTLGDTGTLIPDCERIFEPFFSGRAGGLGIGLFHCRNVAESMGCRLRAENTDMGPQFILELRKM